MHGVSCFDVGKAAIDSLSQVQMPRDITDRTVARESSSWFLDSFLRRHDVSLAHQAHSLLRHPEDTPAIPAEPMAEWVTSYSARFPPGGLPFGRKPDSRVPTPGPDRTMYSPNGRSSRRLRFPQMRPKRGTARGREPALPISNRRHNSSSDMPPDLAESAPAGHNRSARAKPPFASSTTGARWDTWTDDRPGASHALGGERTGEHQRSS